MSSTQVNRGTVLLPAGHSVKALTCVRSLGKRGVTTLVATEDPSVPAGVSRYCSEIESVRSPYEDIVEYKNGLLALAKRPDVRTIIPNREVDAYVLSKYLDEFDDHVARVWPTFPALRAVHDGLELARIADNAEVPVPETWTLSAVEDWDRELIVKARYSILTTDYVDSFSKTECDGCPDPIHPEPGREPSQSTIDGAMHGHEPIVQEFIPIAHEYSYRALYEHGNCVASSLRRQIRGKSYAGGASVCRELTRNAELEALGEQVLDELEWHGLATVQFLEDARTGAYTLAEVNPRTWTSIPCDVRSGADFPYFVWQLATGNRDDIDSTHETGLATHLLFGELQYLASVLRDDYPNTPNPGLLNSVRDVLWSCYTDPRFDYLTYDDPAPFAREARHALEALT